MPNTRQAAKRAARATKAQTANQMWKSAAKSALRKALTAIEKKDLPLAKEAYADAVKVVSKAASAGVLPKTRAARKISRLTQMAKQMLPEALPFLSATTGVKKAPKAAPVLKAKVAPKVASKKAAAKSSSAKA